MALRIITRNEWAAAPPDDPPIKVSVLPTPKLYIHHSGGNEAGAAGMRAMQRHHMETRGFNDIAYNHVIDGNDGAIYDGRGFGIKGGHVLDPENSVCHGICVMGNFNNEAVNTVTMESLVELIFAGWKQGWWELNIRGHRQTMNTDCPGKDLFDRLPIIDRAVRLLGLAPMPAINIPKDEMFLYSSPNQPVFFCDGGISVGLNEFTDLATFTNQNVKMFNLDNDTYAKFRRLFPGD